MRKSVLVVLAALALYGLLGHDGRHHWHEWRYVYSAAHYTVDELARGVFDPGPPGVRTAAEVGAWYWGQLYHEVLLRAALHLFGEGLGPARWILLLYGLTIPLSAWLLHGTLRRARRAELDPLCPALVMMVYPLGAYLGFKLLAEPPALLLAMAAVYLYTRSLDARGPGAAGFVLAAAVALASSLVTMVFLPLLFIGYVVALLATRVGPWSPRHLAARGAWVLVLGAIAGRLALLPFGIGFAEYWRTYLFYLGYVKPFSMYLFNLTLAVGPALLVLPFAASARPRLALRFYATWGLVAMLPLLALSTNYLEARYLVMSLPALAGITALGLEVAVSPSRSWLRPGGGSGRLLLQLAVLALIGLLLIPFLPYEMSSEDLVTITRDVWREKPEALIVLPWNYTDFHCLATLFPRREIYLVQSPLDEEGRPYRDTEWEQRFRRNYGAAFVPDLAALRGLPQQDIVYVGQGVLPPLRRLQRVAQVLGLSFLSERIDAIRPMNHMQQSWLWSEPSCKLEPFASHGDYRAFEVRCGATPAGQAQAGRGGTLVRSGS